MAVDKDKNTQILVTFPNDMVDDIKEFWHDQKLSNRSEAIRALVLKGLEVHKSKKVEQEE
ncbi:hypothetical protein D3C75_1286880 [compost metagenome]